MICSGDMCGGKHSHNLEAKTKHIVALYHAVSTRIALHCVMLTQLSGFVGAF